MGPFFNDCRVEISIFELDLYIDTIIIHVYYENWSSQTNFNVCTRSFYAFWANIGNYNTHT